MKVSRSKSARNVRDGHAEGDLSAASCVVLKPFSRVREDVKAVQYAGTKMDTTLMRLYPGYFEMAIINGQPTLSPRLRGLVGPYSGDWLVFDETGSRLIDVMDNSCFHFKYKAGRLDEE